MNICLYVYILCMSLPSGDNKCRRIWVVKSCLLYIYPIWLVVLYIYIYILCTPTKIFWYNVWVVADGCCCWFMSLTTIMTSASQPGGSIVMDEYFNYTLPNSRLLLMYQTLVYGCWIPRRHVLLVSLQVRSKKNNSYTALLLLLLLLRMLLELVLYCWCMGEYQNQYNQNKIDEKVESIF